MNRAAGPDQLADWRCEFEVLNKFPSAPIYSVVARSWLSVDLLLAAESIDLFGPIAENVPPDETAVKLEIRSVTTSALAINLFRTAVRAVAFACALVKGIKTREEKRLKQLEKEIRFMETRNAKERQTAQIEVMMRTIQVLNKYMAEGAKPDDWLRALSSRGLISTGNDVLKERELENRIGDLAKQIESMKNDFIKALVDKQNQPPPPPPVIQVVQAPAPVTTSHEPPPRPTPPAASEKASGFLRRNIPRTDFEEMEQTETRQISASDSKLQHRPPQFDIPASRLAPRDSRSGTPSVRSVRLEPVQAQVPEEPEPVEVIAEAPLVEAPPVSAPIAPPVTENPKKVKTPPVVAPVVEEPQDVFTSFWGAVTTAIGAPASGTQTPAKASGTQTPKKSVNASPLVQAVMQPPKVAKPVPSAPAPVKVVPPAEAKPAAVVPTKAAVPTSPVKKPVVSKKAVVVSPPKKPLDPKTQMALALKAKQAMLKAKIQQALEIKAMEAKRQAEVEEKAKEIAHLAKKFAPADRTKFIGLPPPPPFKAKAKQPPPQPENALPSVMDTGPPVEVPSTEVQEDEGAEEEPEEEAVT